MANFKLEITGDLDELADLGIGLSKAGFGGQHGIVKPHPFYVAPLPGDLLDPDAQDRAVAAEAEGNLTAAFAETGRTGHAETDAAAKPKRTRKATTVDTPSTGAATFAEQIKEVVASETAAPTEAAAVDATAAAATDVSSSASATTATSDPVVDHKKECQDLVKKLMGDSRYSTKDLLDTLEKFGGKGVTAIADNSPENLPGLFAALTTMAAV